MSENFYSLGFIGGGSNSAAGNAHFVASRMDQLWKLESGVFSRDPQTNLRSAKKYGVSESRLYSRFNELIASEKENLDAVAILTPTNEHYSMVMECLNAGIPVICEKALTENSQQAEEIRKRREEENGFLAVIYNYSGYPMVREMRRLIRDGSLGNILQFQAEMPQEGFIRTDVAGNKPSPQAWRLSDKSIPILHLDLAVHLHELVYYLTGEHPEAVIADQSSRGWFDVIDNTSCLCRYSSNIQGQMWFSKCALGHRNGLRLRIYGSEAAMEWYQLNPEEVLISYSDGRREIMDRASNVKVTSEDRYNRFKAGHPAGFNEALANLYTDIYQALGDYREFGHQKSDEVFSADLALEGISFLEAMVRSVQSGKWEAV